MTKSEQTRVDEWKSRKQNQQPHGKIKSLSELSDEYDAAKAQHAKPEE